MTTVQKSIFDTHKSVVVVVARIPALCTTLQLHRFSFFGVSYSDMHMAADYRPLSGPSGGPLVVGRPSKKTFHEISRLVSFFFEMFFRM
jgi:hypothetical protein